MYVSVAEVVQQGGFERWTTAIRNNWSKEAQNTSYKCHFSLMYVVSMNGMWVQQ